MTLDIVNLMHERAYAHANAPQNNASKSGNFSENNRIK